MSNHIGNQLHGVLRMACCAVWSLLLEFHMKFLQIYFCPAAESSGLTTAYLGVNGEQNCILKKLKKRKVWTNRTWLGSVLHSSKREHITVIGQEGGTSRVQALPKCSRKQAKDRCFLCDRRRSNLASGEPSGWSLGCRGEKMIAAATSKWASSQLGRHGYLPKYTLIICNPAHKRAIDLAHKRAIDLASHWSSSISSTRNLAILTSMNGPRTQGGKEKQLWPSAPTWRYRYSAIASIGFRSNSSQWSQCEHSPVANT